MLTGIHFLLTYTCLYECEHCFLYCSPRAEGVFTLSRITQILSDARRLGTVEWVYFEGGEPFLYYPLLLEGLRAAKDAGFTTGIVTNGYWATTADDAALWLKPLKDLNLADLSISDDRFHNSGEGDNPVRQAIQAARDLGLPVEVIHIDEPCVLPESSGIKGQPVNGGSVLFKGRAADKLTGGLPRHSWEDMTECPHEELQHPERVHIDPFGNVFVCQGISIGNAFESPLDTIIIEYRAEEHPVCGPLLAGGPAQLIRHYQVPHDNNYVDVCHACYCARSILRSHFPRHLTPGLVYGEVNEGSD